MCERAREGGRRGASLPEATVVLRGAHRERKKINSLGVFNWYYTDIPFFQEESNPNPDTGDAKEPQTS